MDPEKDKTAEPEKKEPEKKEEVHPAPEKDPGAPTSPAIDPEQFAQMVKSVSGMVSEIQSLKESVTALANQGSVNASIQGDNGSQKEPEYPTIDLDEVNRLLGV